MRRIVSLLVMSAMCVAGHASAISENFESYELGSIAGQTGPGGLTWSTLQSGGGAEAYAARPGFLSEKSGRWEAEDLGVVSQGDEMLASFAEIGPRITVQAMTYAYLGVDTQYAGRRSASFSVLSNIADGVGVGLVWHASGRIGDTQGGLSSTDFVNAAWVPIRIDLDMSSGQYAIAYGNTLVTSGTLLVRDAAAASVLAISLQTVALNQQPSANDALLIDNITITPEPGAAVVALLAAALLRRR